MSENPDYEVGYKKPPAHTRWQPGQSGNPRGRPKKTKEFEKLLELELDQLIEITERGQRVMLSKRQIILKAVVNNALKGDLRAFKVLLPFLAKQETPERFEPDADDRAALEQLMNEYRDGNSLGDDGV